MLFYTLSCLLLARYVCMHVAAKQHFPDQPVAVKHNGAGPLLAEPPNVDTQPNEMYNARNRDIPFLRLFHGNLKFFAPGELNTPTGKGDVWGHEHDNTNQSACAIPDNAFFISKVAIHPYFLKYAGLDRYCMQDVCISFWREDGRSDMMLKVTDICSTDPNDPTHCASPVDIKVDRTKANIMTKTNNLNDPTLQGDEYPEKVWWFFMKCWDDGIAQPAYLGNNWFTTPVLPSNLKWAQSAALQQMKNNQISYPKEGWETYPNGGYNQPHEMKKNSPPIDDWVPGQEPDWTPVPGGRGWGKKRSSHQPHPPVPNVKPQVDSTMKEEHHASTTHHRKPLTTKETNSYSFTTHTVKKHHTTTEKPTHTAGPESGKHTTAKDGPYDTSSPDHGPAKGYSPETTTKSHHGVKHYGSAPTESSKAHPTHASHHSTHKSKTKSKCSSVYPTGGAHHNPSSTAGPQPYIPPVDHKPTSTAAGVDHGSPVQSPPASTDAETPPPSTAAEGSPAPTADASPPPGYPGNTPSGSVAAGPVATDSACNVPVTVTKTNYVTVTAPSPPGYEAPSTTRDNASSTAAAGGYTGSETPSGHTTHSKHTTHLKHPTHSKHQGGYGEVTSTHHGKHTHTMATHTMATHTMATHAGTSTGGAGATNCTEKAGRQERRRMEPRYLERHKRRARSGGRRHVG